MFLRVVFVEHGGGCVTDDCVPEQSANCVSDDASADEGVSGCEVCVRGLEDVSGKRVIGGAKEAAAADGGVFGEDDGAGCVQGVVCGGE